VEGFFNDMNQYRYWGLGGGVRNIGRGALKENKKYKIIENSIPCSFFLHMYLSQ
jgi:hypothetical protein